MSKIFVEDQDQAIPIFHQIRKKKKSDYHSYKKLNPFPNHNCHPIKSSLIVTKLFNELCGDIVIDTSEPR